MKYTINDPLEGSHPELPRYEFQKNEAGEYRWIYMGEKSAIHSRVSYSTLPEAITAAKLDADQRKISDQRRTWKKIDLSVQSASVPPVSSL